jgi:hypothetical protein
VTEQVTSKSQPVSFAAFISTQLVNAVYHSLTGCKGKINLELTDEWISIETPVQVPSIYLLSHFLLKQM